MTAIIPAAGKGTRFLPATRVIPKEMLPIGAKPAIHCIVEEALAAGADDIVLVISEEKEIIRRYFEGDETLSGKVRYVYQREQRGLGHAVLQAAEGVAGTALVLLGDALVTGPNPSREMVAISQANGGASVVGLERVPPERVSRYGIVALEGRAAACGAGDAARIVDLVEKPKLEEAPSDLAIAGRYLLSADIFSLLATQTPGHGGEIQLTDAIRRLLATQPVFGYVYPGKRQDIGNPQGYLKALEAFNGIV
jgi:UTP--glucose-1-phosphate uridylyltransferase